jgi:CheY-like chemotaxis protein
MPLDEKAKRGTVLILSHEPALRCFVESVVQGEFDFVSAGSWNEAVDALYANSFDIALVDLRLPGIPSPESVLSLLKSFGTAITPFAIAGPGDDLHADAARGLEYRDLSTEGFGPHPPFVEGKFSAADLLGAMRGCLREPADGINDLSSAMLHRLYDFTNEIVSLDTLNKVLDAVIKFLRKITGCLRISIMLLSEDGKHLYIRKAIGLETDVIKSTSIKIGDKIAGKAFARGQIITSRGFGAGHLRNLTGGHSGLGTGSGAGLFRSREYGPFMSIPLVEIPCGQDRKPVGVINLTNKAGGGEFTVNEKQFLRFIANSTSIAIKNELRKEALEKGAIDTLILLANVMEARDNYTQGHSVRVGTYAQEIARRLGYGETRLREIRYAGQLHDIGKIEVPDAILLKPDRLTDSEYGVMKRHPLTSKRIVDHITFFGPIKGIFLHHHEHFDGKGYPDGIGGSQIELGARILAVADAYDAMTSERPYRAAMTRETALSILTAERGKQFDPLCVDAFIDYLSAPQPQNA